MDRFVETLKKYKVAAIISFTAAVCIAAIFVISASFSKSRPGPAQIPISPPQGNFEKIKQLIPSNAPALQSYRENSFAFMYPSDWKAEKLTMSEGEGAMLTLANAPEGSVYPSVIVTSISGSEKSIRAKGLLYNALGYRYEKMFLSGAQAEKWSGTFPVKIVNGKEITSPVQETIALVTKYQRVYTIKFKYEGASKKEDMEQFILGFLPSLVLFQ